MKNLNMNLPNRLTLIRIALVPLFIACFYIEAPSAIYVACGIFIAAFLTDIADGYLARSRNQITDFGKLMDPIADKLLAASALIMLTANGMLNSRHYYYCQRVPYKRLQACSHRQRRCHSSELAGQDKDHHSGGGAGAGNAQHSNTCMAGL